MNAIQLEFQIEDETEVEIKLGYVQKENREIKESLRKVQKKLFAEINELKKLYLIEKEMNEKMKELMRKLLDEKSLWKYAQEGHLFY